MFSDSKVVYICEYVIGFTLLIVVLPFLVAPTPGWSNAHWWAYLLFIVNAGFTFVSCASEMKQRMDLSARIKNLESMIAANKGDQSQTQQAASKKHTASEQLVGSVN